MKTEAAVLIETGKPLELVSHSKFRRCREGNAWLRLLIPARAIHKSWKHVVDAARTHGCPIVLGMRQVGSFWRWAMELRVLHLGIALHSHGSRPTELKLVEVPITGMGKRSMLALLRRFNAIPSLAKTA